MAEIKPLAPRFAAPLDQMFYDIDAVCKVISLSATQIRRMVRAGDFPAPIPVTDGRKAWIAAEGHFWNWQRTPPPAGPTTCHPATTEPTARRAPESPTKM